MDGSFPKRVHRRFESSQPYSMNPGISWVHFYILLPRTFSHMNSTTLAAFIDLNGNLTNPSPKHLPGRATSNLNDKTTRRRYTYEDESKQE